MGKPGILLGDWLDFWYQSYKKPNLRPNTLMSYERRIYQHIIPALGSTQLDKGGTPLSGRMAKSTHATSMPTAKQSAKSYWQN